MSRTATMPTEIPYTRYVGPKGREKLQIKVDVPAICRPYLSGLTALTKFPESGPIYKGQPIRHDQLAEITGTAAEFKAQIERARTQVQAAANPELLAADLITSHAIHQTPMRRPVSRMSTSLVAQTSANLGVAYGGTVAPHLADAVRGVLASHFGAEHAHIENVDSLVAELTAALVQPMPAEQFADVRSRVTAAVTPAATKPDSKPITPEDIIKIWKDQRITDGTPPKQQAIDNKTTKMELLFSWLCANRDGYPKNCRDVRLVTTDDIKAYRLHLISEGVAKDEPSRARDHLIDVIAMFNIAAVAGKITVNPCPKGAIKLPLKQKNNRKSLSKVQQKAILEAASDPEFVRKIATKGQMERGPGAVTVVKWLHWLAALCGGAINSELVGIKVRDVQFTNVMIERDQEYESDSNPEWVVHIRGTKTANRRRTATLHDSLIREKFLEYVESIRQEYGEDAPLFPNWNEDQTGAIANKVIRELGITDEHLSFYSWRHVTKTRLDRVADVSGDLARYVTGGAPVDIHAGTYLHPATADAKRAIDGLVDPTL